MLPFRLANVVEIYRKLMDYVQFYCSSRRAPTMQ